MAITIPSTFWDKYYDVCSNIFLTDNHFSRLCKIYYPPIREECANCTTQWMGGISKNVYQHGGPAPVINTGCSNCAGNGYREKEVTDTIRLRIYWDRKNWIKPASSFISPELSKSSSIVAGDGVAQIIGKIEDLSKLLNANDIVLVHEQKEMECRVKLAADAFYHGFGKNKYFVSFVQKC